MAETIVLDPSEVATGRTSFDLTPWITEAGVEWGDAAMTAAMAQLTVGDSVVDFKIPNRQITIPLKIREVGGTSMVTARSAIQSKIGLWQGQGGWIKRVVSSGTVFCDVVTAQLHLGGNYMQARGDADLDASITLEAIPDFYEAEETLADHVETTADELIFTETTVNGGDFPLGDRVRMVVDEDQAQSQRGMFWAFRGKHYSSATTAASAYEAEALTTLDTATRVAKVGASGGTVITHGTLSTNWTPVVGTNLTAGSYLTHTGTNRIRARVFSTSGTLVQSRFVWDVGDLVLPSENDAVRLYDGGTFHILDLGEVRLDPPPTGPMRWQGQIQAKGDVGGEAFSVDRVWIVNQDESAGVLTAPLTTPQGLVTFLARDEFNQTAGALTGKTAPVGGVWTVVTGSDADDFSVETTGKTAQRTIATNDAGTGVNFTVGRAVTAGITNYTTIATQIDLKTSAVITNLSSGLLMRVGDLDDYAAASVVWGAGGIATPKFWLYAGGVATTWESAPVPVVADAWYTLKSLVLADGSFALWFQPRGGSDILRIANQHVDLATGGVRATGRVGFADYYQGGGVAATRSYDNFAAWVPTPDAVAFASQSVELSTQGIAREDSTGAAYGPVSIVNNDLPRMPNRSSAGTVEGLVKMSRGDFSTQADPGIDDLSGRVFRRASHLLLPS